MKNIGYLLLAAGFLVGAYSTALDTVVTNWMLFAPAALAAIVGVFIVKRQTSGLATSESVLSANRAELTESLANIVSNLDFYKIILNISDLAKYATGSGHFITVGQVVNQFPMLFLPLGLRTNKQEVENDKNNHQRRQAQQIVTT